ncbi:MAG TPA: HEAT repeat domain-containing protein [Pyrinomonadaceae bacterium]|nr:HEAT repeat domain-containing protein [Pyrinomonadaceae bacterium]
MKPNVTKLNRILALAIATAFIIIASGLGQQALAQKYSHRPKATKFAQQGSNNAAATTVFNGGRDLIDDAQWAKAEEAFGQYVAKYPQEKNLDAALYWMAYAQAKLRKYNQSKDTIQKLLKTYEKSIWKEDAELLMAQLPGAPVPAKVDALTQIPDPAGSPSVLVAPVAVIPPTTPGFPAMAPIAPQQDPIRTQEMQERIAESQARAIERNREAQERMQERIADAQEKMKDKFKWDYEVGIGKGMGMGVGVGKGSDDDPNSEIKIVALQALCESDPQRCVAISTDWLKPNSGQTVVCRRAALVFVARHGGKAGTPIILGAAQNDPELKVRTRAISLLGSSNDDSVLSALRDFALNSPQPEVSEAALYALSQHTSPQALNILADFALSTKPIALRKTAISSISSRPGEPAVDALFKIYDSSQDLEIRKAVISGFGNRKSERAGAKLVEIAGSPSENIELRKQAIRSIARRGGESAVDTLMRLYDAEKNEEVKDIIMNSFGSLNDKKVTNKLIEIARNPQTPLERRRRVIMLLSNRGKDPDVIKYLEELLRTK